MLYRARNRAKKLGLNFDLELSDIVMPKYCPITGLELRIKTGNRGFDAASPSIDRKNPNKGYVKGNIGIISMRANKIKSDLSLEELTRLYHYAISEGD